MKQKTTRRTFPVSLKEHVRETAKAMKHSRWQDTYLALLAGTGLPSVTVRSVRLALDILNPVTVEKYFKDGKK